MNTPKSPSPRSRAQSSPAFSLLLRLYWMALGLAGLAAAAGV